MKTYYDINSSEIKIGKLIIPKIENHHDYQVFLKEVEQGEAELVPYIPSWREINKQRNILLSQSDWTAMPDATPKPSKEAWLTYRQALRDIPQNFSTPEEVVFPTKPE